MAATLRVATLNLLNDRSRWVERRPLLVAGLAGLDADLIALQEVTDPRGASSAHDLARDLDGYSVHVAPKTGRAGRREGIAVLSRLAVEGHEVLDLGSQRRVAQFVHVRLDGRPVVLVNVHLHWSPGLHTPRVRQVKRLLDRLDEMEGREPATAAIVAGDFNATPLSPAIEAMRWSFASAYELRHGREADWTCPTPLASRTWLRGPITRGLLGIFSNRGDGPWRGALDYIFVRGNLDIMVREAGVFLDLTDPRDPTLYASDHLGLAATLEIPPA